MQGWMLELICLSYQAFWDSIHLGEIRRIGGSVSVFE